MEKLNIAPELVVNGISPWSLAAENFLLNPKQGTIYTKAAGDFTFNVSATNDSVWIIATMPKEGRIAFRAAFCPGDQMKVNRMKETDDGLEISVWSVIGDIKINIEFNNDNSTILHYTTTLKPTKPLLIPFWPRDVNILGKDGKVNKDVAKVHAQQVGTRSGLIYLSMTKPKSGSIMYFQNLTALADYCQQTETSCADVVGGELPEFGFALPPTKGKPLQEGKQVIINDAFVAFDSMTPEREAQISNQFLDLLAHIYLLLPKPKTEYKHWPEILGKGLQDLDSPSCWSQVKDNRYLNAYISDYTTPPEIMVQLAILLPLIDYIEWSKKELDVIQAIRKNLPTFFNEKIKCINRWLPVEEKKLEGEEEQKIPGVMDSWYLHHPLLNLSRMALKGDKVAEKLFLDSLDYTINVAHHFNYKWPVFYKMDTLEVLKEETKPGKGGEKDVAGTYAHIMLQAYELTHKKLYLDEAEKSAKTLEGLGFEMFYQANNTAFASGAMLRLWKLTKNRLYFELSNLCIANIFKNVHIWECNYGYGKNFSSFFAVFPLSDAPYTAVYEETEVFCALHDYLTLAEDEDILPSIKLLISEFIRHLINRAVSYYPPALPKEMLEEECKVGELNPTLWIALEDMHDGWEKSGSVGQEVYGAGNAFGILPRHYIRVEGEDYMIYVDYPYLSFSAKKGKPMLLTIKGDERINCRMMIVPLNDKLPDFSVYIKDGKEEIKGKATKDNHLEYIIPGNQSIIINRL